MADSKVQVFISYATEDGLLAAAVETALKALVADGAYSMGIIRDVHSFQYGRSLKDSIFDSLDETDILFIIYTEQLKKSHSYTGFEVGVFRDIIRKKSEN